MARRVDLFSCIAIMLSLAVFQATAQSVGVRSQAVTVNGHAVNQGQYTGQCPVNLKYEWMLSAPANAEVKYHLLRSDGAKAAPSHVKAGPKGDAKVTEDWDLGDDSADFKSFAAGETLAVDAPVKLTSKLSITLHCKAGGKPSLPGGKTVNTGSAGNSGSGGSSHGTPVNANLGRQTHGSTPSSGSTGATGSTAKTPVNLKPGKQTGGSTASSGNLRTGGSTPKTPIVLKPGKTTGNTTTGTVTKPNTANPPTKTDTVKPHPRPGSTNETTAAKPQ